MSPSFEIVGILNTTPDSYFDGGKYNVKDAAIKRAGEMLKEGADIIEVGGESTGPGSNDVSEGEELKRVIPIVEALKEAYPHARLSVDTYKSSVAKAAVHLGVEMINDVTAGRSDAEIFNVLAASEAKIVLMFAKDETPRTTIQVVEYDDIVGTIMEFLKERKHIAINAGIAEDRIILDPGLGHFVSSIPKYSFQILAQLKRFTELKCSLFVSPSRKSFLAGSENLAVSDRLPGTIAASVLAVTNGARYIRTHDVLEVRRGCETATAILAEIS